ncbi:MAG: hypothetical protein ACRC41_15030 [Sarcina sp.]
MCKDKKISILTHILTMLITAIVVAFIIKGAGNDGFVEKFSFGSTISSIILSVVAIIYTFVDGSKSTEANNTLVNSAKTIEGNLKDLDNLIDELKGMGNNISKITELSKMIKELIGKNDSAINGWRAMAESAVTAQENRMNSEEVITEMDKNEINLVISKLSYNTKSKLLLFKLAYEKECELDLDTFEMYFNNLLKEDELPSGKDIASEAMIVLDIFAGLELIHFKYENLKIQITQIDSAFIKALNKNIPEEDMMADSAQMRFFGWVYEYFSNK